MRFFLLVLVLLIASEARPEDDVISKTVLGLHPDLAKGTQAMQTGDFEEGIRLILRGLKYAGSARDRAAAYSNLCAGYARTGHFDTAIEYCSQSLELRPDNWRAYHNRTYALLSQGRIEEAIHDARTGLEIAPDASLLHQILGIAERLGSRPNVIPD
ncbi:MAG: tetratricopeptide repeat protein [Gammaproteobacteria bacterium]|nr:tetratricopeptide repeat protein [Gammaproteobacteria bacterium]